MNYSSRVTARQFIYIILFTIFLFLCYFNESNSILKYTDEISTIIVIFLGTYRIIKTGGKINKDVARIIMLMFFVIIVGFLGNSISKVDRSVSVMFLDLFNCLKVFAMYAFATNLLISEHDWNVIITKLGRIVQIIVYVAFICAILNQITDISMSSEVRYGIKGFKFIFLNEGTLSTVCYTYLMILTLALKDANPKRKRSIGVSIILTIIIWVSTLRSRSIAFALFYCLIFYYYVLRNPNNSKKNRVRLWQTALVGIGLIAMSASTFEKYFTNTRMARYQLLFGSLNLAKQYFPIGAGFGTYGTYIAQQYYSPLYWTLGFDKIWGMSIDMRDLLTDSCWPAILGQFGLVGVVFYSLMLFFILRQICKVSRSDKYYYVTALFFVIITLGASAATSTFFHFMTVGQMLLMGLLVSKEKNKT